MTTLYMCDDCGLSGDEQELRPCVEGVDSHHCDECVRSCRACCLDRAEDHAVQVAEDRRGE